MLLRLKITLRHDLHFYVKREELFLASVMVLDILVFSQDVHLVMSTIRWKDCFTAAPTSFVNIPKKRVIDPFILSVFCTQREFSDRLLLDELWSIIQVPADEDLVCVSLYLSPFSSCVSICVNGNRQTFKSAVFVGECLRFQYFSH